MDLLNTFKDPYSDHNQITDISPHANFTLDSDVGNRKVLLLKKHTTTSIYCHICFSFPDKPPGR